MFGGAGVVGRAQLGTTEHGAHLDIEVGVGLGRSPDRGDSYAMAVYKSFVRFGKPSAQWALGGINQGAANVRPEWQ